MLLVMGTVRVDPDKIGSVNQALAKMLAATRAEDGCLAYAFAQDLADPGLIHVSERWRDRAALEAHIASAHSAEWAKAAGGLGITAADFAAYESDGPQPLRLG